MSMEPDDHLAIANELERKYSDALSHALARYDSGEISLESLKSTFEAVFTTVSGLVDWNDLNEIMSEYNDYLNQGKLAT